MSANEAGALASVPDQPAAREVGLWREPWFRILTLVNVSILVVSACVGLVSLAQQEAIAGSWLFIAFPVVPATVVMPALSAVIVAGAAAMSALTVIGEKQKGVRFLRAMTVWGTIVLGVPVVFAACCAATSAIGAVRG